MLKLDYREDPVTAVIYDQDPVTAVIYGQDPVMAVIYARVSSDAQDVKQLHRSPDRRVPSIRRPEQHDRHQDVHRRGGNRKIRPSPTFPGHDRRHR